LTRSDSQPSSSQSCTDPPEIELGYVRNILPAAFATPHAGHELHTSPDADLKPEPPCAIDQEVFCNPGQPVGATVDHGLHVGLPIFAGYIAHGPVDRALATALAHTQGFRLRRWDMGNDCGLALGTSSVNLHNGNLVLSYGLPSGGPSDPPLRLYYNSLAHLDLSPFGRGWSELYHQWVEQEGAGSGSEPTRWWLDRLTNPAGLEWRLARDGAGRIIEIVGPDGGLTCYAYASGLLASITDPRGRETRFEFGRHELLTAVTDPAGRCFAFSYNRRFQLTAWRNPGGEVTRFFYDPCFRLRAVRLPMGEVIRYRYEPGPPRRTFVTHSNGDVTVVTLDGEGNVAEAVLPGGVTESFVWDGFQRLLSVTDGRGIATQLSYFQIDDLSRRLAAVERPIGVTNFVWDAVEGTLQEIIDENLNTTSLM
jgi:YD repeat-containing protein